MQDWIQMILIFKTEWDEVYDKTVRIGYNDKRIFVLNKHLETRGRINLMGRHYINELENGEKMICEYVLMQMHAR